MPPFNFLDSGDSCIREEPWITYFDPKILCQRFLLLWLNGIASWPSRWMLVACVFQMGKLRLWGSLTVLNPRPNDKICLAVPSLTKHLGIITKSMKEISERECHAKRLLSKPVTQVICRHAQALDLEKSQQRLCISGQTGPWKYGRQIAGCQTSKTKHAVGHGDRWEHRYAVIHLQFKTTAQDCNKTTRLQ